MKTPSTEALLQGKCLPLANEPPMDAETVRQHLGAVSGWALRDAAIEKAFVFKNYFETIAFVNALAWVCHAEDHHPDLAVSYARCTVRFNTHSVGGISINDFICAARADALLPPAAP